MLIGKYRHAIDIKNRVFIPNKFRNDIGSKCIISQDIADDCLNLFPYEEWRTYAMDMNKLPKIKMRKARQKVFQNSEEIEMDSSGRIILNQEICREVGLAGAKEAMITGNYSHIQIWSIEAWENFNKELSKEETRKKIIDDLEELGY